MPGKSLVTCGDVPDSGEILTFDQIQGAKVIWQATMLRNFVLLLPIYCIHYTV